MKTKVLTDKERLDFLLKKKVEILHLAHNKPKYAWLARYGQDKLAPQYVRGCVLGYGKTHRSAIDALIRTSKKGGIK